MESCIGQTRREDKRRRGIPPDGEKKRGRTLEKQGRTLITQGRTLFFQSAGPRNTRKGVTCYALFARGRAYI